jgi:hypothetical protein
MGMPKNKKYQDLSANNRSEADRRAIIAGQFALAARQASQQQNQELSLEERNNVGMYGAHSNKTGAIRDTMNQQQFIAGNSKGAASYYSAGSNRELVNGPGNDDSLGLKQKAEERSLEEGGLTSEAVQADQADLGISNPCKMELKPGN